VNGQQLHPILDNYVTHKHPAVTAWLAERPNYHLHFTPTSSSWLNLVERFFAEITQRICRGTFSSVPARSTPLLTTFEKPKTIRLGIFRRSHRPQGPSLSSYL
jgi:transposase